MRIGHGYDVHAFAENRKLFLCGVEIPGAEQGLLGHSDADVALHALMDAMLGAAALGDIGMQFPDSDPQFAGADSAVLLERVDRLLRSRGHCVHNLDLTIVAQVPKLQPYILTMRQQIAQVLGIDMDKVSVKATTEEGLGFTGRKEGIAAHCVCLLDESEIS